MYLSRPAAVTFIHGSADTDKTEFNALGIEGVRVLYQIAAPESASPASRFTDTPRCLSIARPRGNLVQRLQWPIESTEYYMVFPVLRPCHSCRTDQIDCVQEATRPRGTACLRCNLSRRRCEYAYKGPSNGYFSPSVFRSPHRRFKLGRRI